MPVGCLGTFLAGWASAHSLRCQNLTWLGGRSPRSSHLLPPAEFKGNAEKLHLKGRLPASSSSGRRGRGSTSPHPPPVLMRGVVADEVAACFSHVASPADQPGRPCTRINAGVSTRQRRSWSRLHAPPPANMAAGDGAAVSWSGLEGSLTRQQLQ